MFSAVAWGKRMLPAWDQWSDRSGRQGKEKRRGEGNRTGMASHPSTTHSALGYIGGRGVHPNGVSWDVVQIEAVMGGSGLET